MPEKRSVVVAGGGRVGFHTVVHLDDLGHDCTVVEADDDRCEAIADEFVATVIQGDATDPATLEQAGIADADVVAGLTGETGSNLAVCLLAREFNPDARTVARIDRGDGEHYERFVDATVFPERAGARVAADEIVGASVTTVSGLSGDLDIHHVRVAEDAPAAGRTLAEVRLPDGSIVISDETANFVAKPETVLVPGERYVVAVEPAVADEVMNLLRG